jgi:hypothetical protein
MWCETVCHKVQDGERELSLRNEDPWPHAKLQ